MLTQSRLREVLEYQPETGIFIRISGYQKRIGKVAGRVHPKRGYREIHIDGKLYYAHRLAWLYMTGEWPKDEVDHKNHIRDDNKWSNLRDVTASVNQQNRIACQKNSKSGFLGVKKHERCKSRPWQAQIKSNGKILSLGYFSTPEEAHEAYINAKRIYHSGCII